MTGGYGGDGSSPTYTAAEIARAWFTRLRGETDAAMRREFDDWLAETPSHRDAYARVQREFENAARLKASDVFGTHRKKTLAPSRPRGWWIAGGAAAAAMLIMVVGTQGTFLTSEPSTGGLSAHAAEPLVTQRGEIRTFKLGDGTTATLDTDSAAEFVTSASERRLRLSRGRARVQVAADARPFRIEAGSAVVTTKQATLDVAHQEAGAITVAMTSGAATLGAAAEEGAPITLRAGAMLSYRPGAPVLPLPSGTAAASADWTTGWTEQRSIRLDILIAMANRYAATPLVLDDPALGGRTLSGRFRISEPEELAHRIATLFDLDILRRDDRIYLRPRKFSKLD